MVDFAHPEDLRREPTPDHRDLLGWEFQEKWEGDDTATVLLWADPQAGICHEQSCTHVSSADPTAKCVMKEVREVWEVERLNGTDRYFGFCGHCLTRRIKDFGWAPSERDLAQIDTMKLLLNDLRILNGRPITEGELLTKMGRYASGAPTLRGLRRQIGWIRHNRGDEELDLVTFIVGYR